MAFVHILLFQKFFWTVFRKKKSLVSELKRVLELIEIKCKPLLGLQYTV